jgi:tetratricopeptide (TPR) repeat protein
MRGDAFRERGIVYVTMQKMKEAQKDFTTAISLNTNDAAAYYQRGWLAERGKNAQAALEDYAEAMDIKYNYEEVFLRRGIVYFTFKKDNILAAADFAKVIELNPENWEAYLWRGKSYYNGEDFKSAEKDLTKYLEHDSTNVDALITRGASRLSYNNFSKAIEDFDAALALEPKNYIALSNRGLAKGSMKQFDSALEDLDLAIKLKFDYSPAYINRAMVKYMNKNKKGGCKDLEKADGLNNPKAYPLIKQYCSDIKK